MDKIKFCDLISFVLAVSMAVVSYNFFTFRKEIKSDIVSIQTSLAFTQSQTSFLSHQVDSLQSTNKIFAKSILYLDSCQVNKGQKAERAERRGRFLGGIIKGLFPGM
jgi:hypothetical protein